MKKNFIFLLLIIFTSFFTVSCKKEKDERTFMADGTYMAWNLSTKSTDLLNADGLGVFKFTSGEVVTSRKVLSPVLTTVCVTVVNDMIVKYEIDEYESIAKVGYVRGTNDVNLDDNGDPLSVTWVFNSRSNKQLGYDYNLSGINGAQNESCPAGSVCKEWFLQVSELERFWLKNSPENYTIKTEEQATNDENIPGVTIDVSNYQTLAKEAISNAKKGIASAVIPFEHYTYDVCFVTAKVDEMGHLSDVKLNAQVFGSFVDGENNPDAFDPTKENYLSFGWNKADKYSSYPEMSNSKTWQSMIDKVNEYINDNGWDSSLIPGRYINETFVDKGLTNNGEEIEILSSVTIQLSNEVKVMNMLANFFPRGFEK